MSVVRIAAFAAIVTLLSTGLAHAKPVAVTTDTNLRKAAGTNSEVVTLIPKGTTVEVGKCSNGWCEASLNGQDGFVIARNVGIGPRPPPGGGPAVIREEIEDGPPVVYGPPRAYVVGPPVYYGYGPYYGYGWGYRGWGWGWGRRW
jgi:hypothetical protein